MKRLYFIRHGETKYNSEGRFIGSTDLSLSHEGRQKIADKWEKLSSHIDAEMLFSSPMKRCTETANIIFPNMEPVLIDNFRELNFGVFEGKIYEEVKDLDIYKDFVETRGRIFIPDGESGISFGKRVLRGFFELISIMNDKDVNDSAIVCHGGVIMSLFSMLCRESDDFYYYHIDNGCGYSAHYDEHKKELIIIDRI